MSNNYVDDETGKFNTQSMLEDTFLNNLKNGVKGSPRKASKSIQPTESLVPEKAPSYNTEEVLTNLYTTRDELIDAFKQIGINANSQAIVNGINRVGSCIRSIGGEVENFDPFMHMSGLQAPSLVKNAKRVIENTQESYSLGNITDLDIKENGKVVIMAFNGQKDNVIYKATGTITASKGWIGNEAIDYIWTPAEGKMSVKTFDGSNWVDKSNDYHISWELMENEIDLNASVKNITASPKKEAGNVIKNVEIKEEVEKVPLNNIDVEISDDFEITEKE